MPPRKRARVSQASTPQPKTSIEASSPAEETAKPNPLNDLWTDDEESQLFKSLIKHKPTGIHKHFRMMAIAKDFQSHGFMAPGIKHTHPAGIWAKLDALYDLDVLDERENHHMGILATPSETDVSEKEDEDEEADEREEDPWRRREFELLDEDFEERTFEKRLDETRSSSPEAIEGLNRTRNLLGEEELREKREEYDKEDGSSVRGKGSKIAAARAARGKGGRSTRSTPAEVEDSEEEGDGDDGSTVDDSPESKAGRKKAPSRAVSTRRGRKK